jgi:hypothetical protein
VTSRAFQDGDLRLMLELIQDLWPGGRPGYPGLLDEMLAWAEPERTTVRSGDDETAALLESRGFAHDADAPWLRMNARAFAAVEEPVLPRGYRLATMAEYGNFESRAAAHRSAFHPSRFTDRVYEVVRRETPWRAEQRRGLCRAVCLHALRRLRSRGAETALVGSRGDDDYPGPRALYESIGFRELWRDLVFARKGRPA